MTTMTAPIHNRINDSHNVTPASTNPIVNQSPQSVANVGILSEISASSAMVSTISDGNHPPLAFDLHLS